MARGAWERGTWHMGLGSVRARYEELSIREFVGSGGCVRGRGALHAGS